MTRGQKTLHHQTHGDITFIKRAADSYQILTETLNISVGAGLENVGYNEFMVILDDTKLEGTDTENNDIINIKVSIDKKVFLGKIKTKLRLSIDNKNDFDKNLEKADQEYIECCINVLTHDGFYSDSTPIYGESMCLGCEIL